MLGRGGRCATLATCTSLACGRGGTGRRWRLKIFCPWGVRVRVPPSAPAFRPASASAFSAVHSQRARLIGSRNMPPMRRADLPAHLGLDRADAGHVERHVGADPHRLRAFGHEAAGRDVAHLDLDLVAVLRSEAASGRPPPTRSARRGLKPAASAGSGPSLSGVCGPCARHNRR